MRKKVDVSMNTVAMEQHWGRLSQMIVARLPRARRGCFR